MVDSERGDYTNVKTTSSTRTEQHTEEDNEEPEEYDTMLGENSRGNNGGDIENHTLPDPGAGRKDDARGTVSEKFNDGDGEVQKKLEQLFDDQFAEKFNRHIMKHMATMGMHNAQDGLTGMVSVRANAQDAGGDCRGCRRHDNGRFIKQPTTKDNRNHDTTTTTTTTTTPQTKTTTTTMTPTNTQTSSNGGETKP